VCVCVNLHCKISVANTRDTEEVILIAVKISTCYLITSNHVLYRAVRTLVVETECAFKWVVKNE